MWKTLENQNYKRGSRRGFGSYHFGAIVVMLINSRFLILAQISISIEGFEEFDGGDLEVGRHIVISYQLPDGILQFQKLF